MARDLVEADPDRGLPDLASALDRMADRSRTVRRREAAARLSAEALEVYETLTRRSVLTFGRQYASCLSNHSIYLAEAELPGDYVGLARRSVEILRRLAMQDPLSYRLELALALSRYAVALGEEERWEESIHPLENAIRVIDELPAAPGNRLRAAAIRSNLAESLRLIGKHNDAKEILEAATALLDSLDQTELHSIPGIAAAIRTNFENFKLNPSWGQ